MKTIRWAILGAGKIAQSFVKDFPLMENASLVAVASSDSTRGQAFASEHRIPKATGYQELYESKEVDAVYIATTHNFHFEQVMQCLQHGKAVLCEKPITVNPEQFDQLAKIAKANNVFLMEAMWSYFLPAIQKAKLWLDEGRIGQLKYLQSDFGVTMEKKPEGRMYNPRLAGGALLDLGIYPIAIAYYFTGKKPVKILAAGKLTETGVDETIGMLFQYEDVTASLSTSMVTRFGNVTRICGELGYMEIPEFWKTKEVRLYNNDHQLVDSFNDGRLSHGFIYEMQHANNCIIEGHLESPIMPHSRSSDLQLSMMEVRNQVGWKYPFE
ncbi:MAG: Gfo/Idh/MocA family oxidoreductase [Bacteroidota bacterium]